MILSTRKLRTDAQLPRGAVLKARPHHRTFVALTPPTKRFHNWILEYGLARLARTLGCSDFTVYNWRRGARPSNTMAAKVIVTSTAELPHDGAPLTWNDCLGLVKGSAELALGEGRSKARPERGDKTR